MLEKKLAMRTSGTPRAACCVAFALAGLFKVDVGGRLVSILIKIAGLTAFGFILILGIRLLGVERRVRRLPV